MYIRLKLFNCSLSIKIGEGRRCVLVGGYKARNVSPFLAKTDAIIDNLDGFGYYISFGPSTTSEDYNRQEIRGMTSIQTNAIRQSVKLAALSAKEMVNNNKRMFWAAAVASIGAAIAAAAAVVAIIR